ncbi:NtaA/DmoA family FMN-dependent monooxygenase [Streptomyces violaceusniger]|uniref:FMN-dependent oxidoreductase, nitrilotriacetate monooxygenase family n=1 Tax=Streptomyces violaceusniger (strain Tu 4113) TaxID=653045 RepID=G2PF85_STRV4|nr:NtaA/DmoA family FMN-dependent monooxygenase [Streptomyces violaceusniger]AEM84228.1 FMN-dependent oxidoreductase, nitrilotriacetate monooxygenase family [Streptomyces violaceusniger Tu 4113]
MTGKPRHMHLFLVIGNVGQHHGAWREPDSGIELADSIDFHAEVAQRAEAAKLDAVFIADHLAMLGREAHAPAQHLEPVTVLSALSMRTESIGLVGSASTTFNEPFNVARQFASLDHLSRGRAGWNIVTSAFGEENFGSDPLPSHASRYERAGEFVEVTKALWRSWDADALAVDRDSGVYARSERVHPINFQGEHLTVSGPLNIPRPPQVHPVLVQAGTSADGMAFASRHAEVVFSAHQGLPMAKRYYDEIKNGAKRLGRDPDSIKVLFGLSPILGDTQKDAEERQRALAGLLNIDYAKQLVAFQLGGIDLTNYDLDEKLPLDVLPDPTTINRRQGRFDLYRQLIEDGETLRRLTEVEATAAGLQVAVGDVERMANEMITYFEAAAADGFILIPPSQRVDGRRLLSEVIPLLQERGYARATYQGTTLREHLGLARP